MQIFGRRQWDRWNIDVSLAKAGKGLRCWFSLPRKPEMLLFRSLRAVCPYGFRNEDRFLQPTVFLISLELSSLINELLLNCFKWTYSLLVFATMYATAANEKHKSALFSSLCLY